MSEFFKAQLTKKKWLIVAEMVNKHSRENRYVLSHEDYQAALEFIATFDVYFSDIKD
jgi:hypothetical protein